VVFTELTNHAAPHRSAICEQALLENKRKTSQQKKYIKISTDGSGVQWRFLRGFFNSVEKKGLLSADQPTIFN